MRGEGDLGGSALPHPPHHDWWPGAATRAQPPKRIRRLLIGGLLIASTGCGPAVVDGDREAVVRVAIAGGDIPLAVDTLTIRGEVPRHATLDAMLRAHGLAPAMVDRMIGAAREVFDLRRLRSLQPFSLTRSVAGALRIFEYEIDADRFLRVSSDVADPSTVTAEVLPIPKTLELVVASGAIDSRAPSLFQAMEAAGERVELAVGLAELFSSDVDFNTELQPNDHFTVAFERFRREGRPTTYGVITAAGFYNNGRALTAIRFTPPGGKPGYYDEQGRSIRRFFLRSPLKFEPRITSGFSASRRHPVLHTARAHRGVDYAAPTGAPVVAVSNGTVVSVTSDATNGRMVRLRHGGDYESYYLHLSAFAQGLQPGAHVAQGQTIGFVGATGLATGPHLHFGLKQRGQFVNPLQVQRNTPPGDPIPESAMPSFIAVRDQALAALAQAKPRRPDALQASR